MQHTARKPKTYIHTGFSYKHQCWIVNQIVQDCGHLDHMLCQCYGRIHKGEKILTEE